jgi:pyruvate dehydrogenase E2 component (dihydrolipoamide acetyltransferase)
LSTPVNPPAGALDPELVARLERLGIMRDRYEIKPLDRVHKFIAQRLTDAARDTPSFPLEMNIPLDALLHARAVFNARGQARVSVNDVLIKAAALALTQVPKVNVSFTPDGLVAHQHADIAVAVATDLGLVTPIIREAQAKSVVEIAEAMRDLAARARARRLKPDEYTGGTFSLSNLGMYGISRFGSIINPPHAAILSVGAAEERLLARNGAPVVCTMMTVVMTCDHRALDGATGARWLQAFRDLLQNPEALLL